MTAAPRLLPERPRDPRSRAVLANELGPGANVTLRLECGHSVRRKRGLCPPSRAICTCCPQQGGFGSSAFPHPSRHAEAAE